MRVLLHEILEVDLEEDQDEEFYESNVRLAFDMFSEFSESCFIEFMLMDSFCHDFHYLYEIITGLKIPMGAIEEECIPVLIKHKNTLSNEWIEQVKALKYRGVMFKNVFKKVSVISLLAVSVSCFAIEEPLIDFTMYEGALKTIEEKSYLEVTREQMNGVLKEQLSPSDYAAVSNGHATTLQFQHALETVLDSLNAQLTFEANLPWLPYHLLSLQEGFPKANKSQYGGLGLQLANFSSDETNDQQFPVVDRILLDSIYFDGVRVGDEIVAVDGFDAIQLKKSGELLGRLRGAIDSKVTLALKRGSQMLELELKRRAIHLPVVELTKVVGHSAVIKMGKIYQFDSVDEMGQILNTLEKFDISELVLDLRGVPGGFLQGALNCQRYFAKENDLLLKRTGVTPSGKEGPFYASEEGKASHLKLKVLVNRETAGAAEVMAAYLQNQGHTLIGEKTLGRGRLTHIYDVGESFKMRLLVGHVLLPSGELIQGNGVIPDIKVDDTEALQEALKQ